MSLIRFASASEKSAIKVCSCFSVAAEKGGTSLIFGLALNASSQWISTCTRNRIRPYSLKRSRSGATFAAYRPSSGDSAVRVGSTAVLGGFADGWLIVASWRLTATGVYVARILTGRAAKRRVGIRFDTGDACAAQAFFT